MMIVLAFEMSSPVSTIVVETSTSYLRSQNPSTTSSSACSPICPWATAMRASGTSSARCAATRWIDCTRLCT